VFLVLAACAPAPAEKLRNPRPKKRPITEVAQEPTPATAKATWFTFPRPDIPVDVRIGALRDAMDVSEHLRWPLTGNHHPALEPAYPVASVFAATGVAWTDLCKIGAQSRRTSGVPLEQVDYLRAWCDVARHEPEAAVVRLAPLVTSTIAGLPAAVRRDITNIVVDSGDAAYGQRLLARARFDEVAMFDLIAASYEEVGKTDNAMVFNDLAIDAYTMHKPGDHCRRLAKRVVTAVDPDERKVRIAMIGNASTDSTCQRLHNELQCWSGKSCVDYMADNGIDTAQAGVVDLYMSWPTSGATPSFWVNYAQNVVALAGTPGADVLGTAALEASLLSLGCVGERVHVVRANAHDIQINAHDKTLDARLELIVAEPKKLCETKP
jgi:hypothetical protein